MNSKLKIKLIRIEVNSNVAEACVRVHICVCVSAFGYKCACVHSIRLMLVRVTSVNTMQREVDDDRFMFNIWSGLRK